MVLQSVEVKKLPLDCRHIYVGLAKREKKMMKQSAVFEGFLKKIEGIRKK